MSTSQDKAWKDKEQGAEAAYARQKAHVGLKEEEQLARIRAELKAKAAADARDKDFEGGHGGQEDLEDRYATTSGEH
ncbi:hypothetical protein MIND_01074100 [Mycena indigotica]|uniref:Uncharacterized protein n=1 Tax=Mycena indigotica TaxID=2126181 RepID=A0A8H6SBM3_9AGAR|nr:uncharacterized protein MIND_01074100 [Mycena indigotica]KAF7295347.1 hypothetical protein MIND_01074100 [Mycena indigotica]